MALETNLFCILLCVTVLNRFPCFLLVFFLTSDMHKVYMCPSHHKVLHNITLTVVISIFIEYINDGLKNSLLNTMWCLQHTLRKYCRLLRDSNKIKIGTSKKKSPASQPDKSRSETSFYVTRKTYSSPTLQQR